jgi:hypothetical protein
MEIRMLTTQLLQHFDVPLARSKNGCSLFHGTFDHFILGLAPLKLVLEREKKVLDRRQTLDLPPDRNRVKVE